MEEKNGFTLVELLAILVITSILGVIGTYSVMGIIGRINQNLWDNKVELIENRAAVYGDDYKNRLTGTCTTADGTKYENCFVVTVGELIQNGIISTKDKNDSGEKVIINNTKNKEDSDYYANNMKVVVYKKNERVYAVLVDGNVTST